MINGKKLIAVLPAYNAALTLKKTYEEIRSQFQHLTHIGFSSEDIDAYSKKYYEFFQKMKIAKGEFTSSSSSDQVQTE